MATRGKTFVYRDAMERVEAIVRELDRPDLSLDQLAPLVDEAAGLLVQCREVLNGTTLKVNATLARLTAGAGGEAATSSRRARKDWEDDEDDDDDVMEDIDEDDDED